MLRLIALVLLPSLFICPAFAGEKDKIPIEDSKVLQEFFETMKSLHYERDGTGLYGFIENFELMVGKDIERKKARAPEILKVLRENIEWTLKHCEPTDEQRRVIESPLVTRAFEKIVGSEEYEWLSFGQTIPFGYEYYLVYDCFVSKDYNFCLLTGWAS